MDIKQIHAKPSYYAIMFEPLKEIAFKYGYNLVLHGSLNRDMDLIAIPWVDEIKHHLDMINEMADFIGGKLHLRNKTKDDNGEIKGEVFSVKPHGRICYVIDIYRGGYVSGAGFTDLTYFEDPQTYIDISIIPNN